MDLTTIDKPDEIHKILKKYRKSSRFKFRGQSNSKWSLIPKAGRSDFSKVKDSEAFRNWKRRAKIFIQNNDNSDWDLLSIAQHTGLPTRLLDWTHNPLAALFFACIENPESDGALFVINTSSYFSPESFENPFSTPDNKIILLQPAASNQRIANQFGYFTVHNKPSLQFTKDSFQGELSHFEKIEIPKELKGEIAFMLNQYGVNYLTIYPDLEGLSKHLCWFAQNYQYWDNTIDED